MKKNYTKYALAVAAVALCALALSDPAFSQAKDFTSTGTDALDTITNTVGDGGRKVYNMIFTIFGVAALVFTGYNGAMFGFGGGDERHKNRFIIGIAAVVIFILTMIIIRKVFFQF